MRCFSPEEKADQNFRKVLQQISTEPNTIRHRCTKCRLGLPSLECLDCFALLCQGCVRLQGHDPNHKVVFHHPENQPQNAIPGQSLNQTPPDMHLTGIYGIDPLKREFIEGLGEQPIPRRCPRRIQSDSDSDVSVQDLKRSVAREYKAVRTTANAKALFEKSVKVCHDCNFAIFEPAQATEHANHHVTDPHEAGEAIKAIFQKLATNGPLFVQRGEEAQHLCILERNKIGRLEQECLDTLNEAYKTAVKILHDFESGFTKSLAIGVDQRMAEMDVIDSVLYHQIKLEDRYDAKLAEILEIGSHDPGQGINMWREYCREVRKCENEKYGDTRAAGLKNNRVVPGGISFSQLGEYIENVTMSVKKMKVSYDSLIAGMSGAIGDHIERTIMKPDKIIERLENNDLLENNLLGLRESLKLQSLTGMPVRARSSGGNNDSIPYATNIGPVSLCSFFYMMDTFHTKWTKVYVAIHDQQWLAIYVPNEPHVIESDDPLRGFRAGDFADIVEESEPYQNPPESILNLVELQVNLIKNGNEEEVGAAQLMSPIGKLLSEVVMLPAFEILRIIKGRVQGWWVFVHPEARIVREWTEAISNWGSNEPGRQRRWPDISSTYVPSTNPGTPARSLGLAFPPIGRRWGAIHVREAPRMWEKSKGEGSDIHQRSDEQLKSNES